MAEKMTSEAPTPESRNLADPSVSGDDGLSSNDFVRQADGPSGGIVREFADFLRYNKKWWLTPVVVILLAVAALLVLSSTAAAPFIYTLF